MNAPDDFKRIINEIVESVVLEKSYYCDDPIFSNPYSSKDNHFGYIYLTIFKPNGKLYVGKHKCVSFDKSYIGSGVIIVNAKKGKYNREDFFVFVIEYVASEEHAVLLEKEYVKLLKDCFPDQCCNLADGGYDTSMIHNAEARRKSIKTRTELYGAPMQAAHTPEAEAKSARTHELIYGSVTGHMLTEEAKAKKDNTFIQKYGNRAGTLLQPETQLKSQQARIDKYGTNVGRMHDPDVRAKAQAVLIEKHGSLMAQCHTEAATQKAFASRAKGHNGDPMWMLHNPEAQAKAAAARRGMKWSITAIKKRVYNRLVRAGKYYGVIYENGKKVYKIGKARLCELLNCKDKSLDRLINKGISKKNFVFWKKGIRKIIVMVRPRNI